MNKNELKQMLSQVDERYIAELLDAEEMTAEEIPVISKKPQFGKYVAIAAAVCICVAGGCWMLSKQGGVQTVPDSHDSGVSVGQSADTSIEEHMEYDLIWETPENFACIDYTWDAGGESVKVTNPTLPFAADAYSIREAHFNLDANGTPENLYLIVHGGGGDNTIRITLHEKGHLFPANFFVDLSADAGREKPAIHIYETTSLYGEENTKQSFELYFIWNGVGFSMECDGISLQEAEQIAASFLNQTCAGLFAENDPSRYFALEQPLVASADFSIESENGIPLHAFELGNHPVSFDTDAFFDAAMGGSVYLREDGSAANLHYMLTGADGRTALIIMSRTGEMFAHGQLEQEGGVQHDGVRIYGCHETEQLSALAFHAEGTDFLIELENCSDAETIALVDALLLHADDTFQKIAAPQDSVDFFQNTDTIGAREEIRCLTARGRYETDDFTLPFPNEAFDTRKALVCDDTDGNFAMVTIDLSNSEASLQIIMAQSGLLFDGGQFADMTPITREAVSIYSARSAEDPDALSIGFTFFKTDYLLKSDGMTEEELSNAALSLIRSYCTPKSFTANRTQYLTTISGDALLTPAQADALPNFAGLIPQESTFSGMELQSGGKLNHYAESEIAGEYLTAFYENGDAKLNVYFYSDAEPHILTDPEVTKTSSLDTVERPILEYDVPPPSMSEDGITSIPMKTVVLTHDRGCIVVSGSCTDDVLWEYIETIRGW